MIAHAECVTPKEIHSASNAWPIRRIILWWILATVVIDWQGSSYLRAIRPDFAPPGIPLFSPDFFQDWASARNFFNGLPIYTAQEITVERYLGIKPNPENPSFIKVNAHPPTSVFLALPLAGLDFADAFLVWNIISLASLIVSAWLIVRHLKVPWSGWDILPAITLLTLCHPFWHQMVHAQLNLVLLLLITGIWVAARTRRDKFAGILLGIATAIKLFPGFLFLYFVFRRNWKVVGWGTGSLVLISIFTVVILGLETFNDYVNDGIKGALEWKSAPGNMSLPGMWNKLFDPGQKRLSVLLVPVFQSSLVATIGSIITTGLFVVILAKVIPAAQSQSECDMAFALDVVAMLLVTPITWNHYCLLLILPLALLADRVRRFELTRNLLWFILLVLFISEWALTDHLMVLLAANRDSAVGWVSPPWVTMLVLSTHVYALAGLFGLCLFFRRDGQPSVKEAVPIIPF